MSRRGLFHLFPFTISCLKERQQDLGSPKSGAIFLWYGPGLLVIVFLFLLDVVLLPVRSLVLLLKTLLVEEDKRP